MDKALRLVYNKIVEQSKKNFFFNDINLPNSVDSRLELFQLNLIIILWYMKLVDLKKNYSEYIISFFVKDLDNVIREFGEPDSRIAKNVRTMTENFYGRLYSYSTSFDEILSKRKCRDFKKKLKKNFGCNSINYSELEKYIFSNIIFFSKLKVSDFLKLKFTFASSYF